MNLGTVAAIRSGLVLSRKLSPEISSYRYPLLNLRAIHPDGYVRPDSLEVFYATEPLRQEYLTQQDDIIIRLASFSKIATRSLPSLAKNIPNSKTTF